MEWFGNKNPQLHKAGGTLAVISAKNDDKRTMITIETVIDFFNDLKNKDDFDTSKPLLYGYFFTDESKNKLLKVSGILENIGFKIVDIFDAEVEEDETPFFYLHIEKIEIHTPNSLDARNKYFYELADKYGLESYDGFDIGNIDS
ncbi:MULTISPECIES: ribonuclease E inhibitor RraB [Flavobacterium]|uniref:ribonuclease E inhibitor RraB n=1 Tax=Flavobacterium TaxID=237 RepID=UPI001FCCA65E|nr:MULTISPECIES: ribonuclease E inhibitor RraB [Flavobacterium]UOK41614.1 ribonuclease E inhibitor RraB [Flavobacterium enshiense]